MDAVWTWVGVGLAGAVVVFYGVQIDRYWRDPQPEEEDTGDFLLHYW